MSHPYTKYYHTCDSSSGLVVCIVNASIRAVYRRFMVLRENAGLNRDAATAVKRETSSLRRRKGDKLACVATAQAKLEVL